MPIREIAAASKAESPARSLWRRVGSLDAAASLAALGAAVAIRIAMLAFDQLNYDEYALMAGVNRSFADYAAGLEGSFGMALVIHYWMSFRLLGGGLLAFRAASFLVSVLTLACVLVVSRRMWPSDPVLRLTLLLFVGLNEYAVYTSWYAPIAYSVTLFGSVCLFFLALHLAEHELDSKHWARIGVVSALIGFFSHPAILLTALTALVSVGVYRASIRERPAWRVALATAWEGRLLALIPVALWTSNIVLPFRNFDFSQRPDLALMCFPSSGKPASLGGAGVFLQAQSAQLLESVARLQPVVRMSAPGSARVAAVILALSLMFVVTRRADSRATFTALFASVGAVGAATGSLLGVFPLGSVRYAPLLLVPFGILSGFAAQKVLSFTRHFRIPPKAGAVTVQLLAIGLCCVIGVQAQRLFRDNASQAAGDAMIIAAASQPGIPVLVSNFVEPAVRAKAPYFAMLQPIGWGEAFADDAISAEVTRLVNENAQGKRADEVIVLTDVSGLAPYAELETLLSRNFDAVGIRKGSWISSYTFVRRSSEPSVHPSPAGLPAIMAQ